MSVCSKGISRVIRLLIISVMTLGVMNSHTHAWAQEPDLLQRAAILGFSMTTGIIVAVVFLGIIIFINRGQAIIERLIDLVEYMNERKHGLRKHGPDAITKLRKSRVVKTLTDEQIPQVKEQIEEIFSLINRHVATIHQHREAAVTHARSSGLTVSRTHYEQEYAKQVDMINAAVPKLITEADRISAVDADYKQHVHDWILAMRKSLEDCDPKHFEKMARTGSEHNSPPQ